MSSEKTVVKPKRLRVAMLLKTQSSVRQTVAYLFKRGVDVVFVKSLKELIQKMTEATKEGEKFTAVFVSVNFPHQRIDTIPSLIEQSFGVSSIVFAEDQDRRSTAKLSAVQAPNVVYGALSGPAAFLRLKNILKKDEMAAMMQRQREEALENARAADAEEALEKPGDKNRVVHIKHDKAEPKGKAFYHFKKDPPVPGSTKAAKDSSVDGEGAAEPEIVDDEAYKQLLAEADSDLGVANEEGSAESVDGLGPETDLEGDFTDSGSPSEGLDSFQESLANESSRGESNVDDGANSEFEFESGEGLPSKSKGKASSHKKRAASGDPESPNSEEKATETEDDIFKDPAASDVGFEGLEGESGSKGRNKKKGAKEKKVREHAPIKNDQDSGATEDFEHDPVYAAGAREREAKEGMDDKSKDYFFNSDARHEQETETTENLDHVSFHHPTPRDERMFDDVLKRCARATLKQLKMSVADLDPSRRSHVQAKIIAIKVEKICGSLFISTGLEGEEGKHLIERATQIFVGKAMDRGLNSELAKIKVYGISTAGPVMSELHDTNFSLCGQLPDEHLMMCFIHGLDLSVTIPEPEYGHYSITVDDLQEGQPVNFDVFLKLELNNKFIRYLRSGLSLTPEQTEKLRRYLVQKLYVNEKDKEELRQFNVVKNIKARKKKAA